MEHPDIDWNRVISRYVRDEVYENINCPKWVDLTFPDAAAAVDDDEAWFCRPDCRHPKTAEDFLKLTPSPKGKRLLRSNSAVLPPFSERNDNHRDNNNNNNLKRRGGIDAFMAAASPLRGVASKPKKPPKKYQDDIENQDPSMVTPPPARTKTRPPFGVPRMANNAKASIKSSAEKKPIEEEKEELLHKNHQPEQPRRLKSTLSARNLFSGKDILSQISDFYNDLKRMAVGSGRTAPETKEEEEVEEQGKIDMSPVPMKESNRLEKCENSSPSPVRKEVRASPPMKESTKLEKCSVRAAAGGVGEKSCSVAVLKEVRASPPTPQRLPSPSTYKVWQAKGSMTAMGSPLKKPLKSTPERGVRKEVQQRGESKMLLIPKDENCTASVVSDAEGSSASFLWFWKPCSYLVE